MYTCIAHAHVSVVSQYVSKSSPNEEVACAPPPSAVCTSRSSLGSVVVVYPQCVGVLVCVVCGETHRQHCLVVTPVTS